MVAAACGHLAMVQALLAKGAEVNAKTPGGWTALMNAAEGGHLAVVQALLDKGADVNAKTPNGWSALMWAAGSGRFAGDGVERRRRLAPPEVAGTAWWSEMDSNREISLAVLPNTQSELPFG